MFQKSKVNNEKLSQFIKVMCKDLLVHIHVPIVSPIFKLFVKFPSLGMKSQNWEPIVIIQGEIKFESLYLTFVFRTHLKNFFETFSESTFEGCLSIETFGHFFFNCTTKLF